MQCLRFEPRSTKKNGYPNIIVDEQMGIWLIFLSRFVFW